ncbi:MAG: hypothetical protein JWO65_1810 [Sphingomonas bacterium]|nr:hypothetical protein [Sphingomonas bacterium]
MATRGGGGRRSSATNHEGFLRHAGFRWAKLAAGIAIVAILIYAFDNPLPKPNGGSAYGYTLGTIGALLILWLTALGLRKRMMTRGHWSLKGWTSAHVYLGLALLVIGTLHTGFQFGWNVHTLAYVLMVFVIVSGMIGVGFYATLPRALSDNRGELTETQMIDALRALDRQLYDTAQPLERAPAELVRAALEEDPFAAGLWRRLTGRFGRGPTQTAVDAFRIAGRGGINDRIDGLLERRRSMLARMRRHIRLKALLEAWLYVHIPATIALLAALTAHIVAVFFYW